jgi:hypothetical protein
METQEILNNENNLEGKNTVDSHSLTSKHTTRLQ